MTNRDAIYKLRKDLNEWGADTGYDNQYLFNSLMVNAKWLVKREVSAGRIYKNSSLFQTLPVREVIEVPTVPDYLGIKTKCKIYRTKNRLPEMWIDNNGPIIKSISSVDRSTDFTVIGAKQWFVKKQDPYARFSKEKYCFFEDGYLWFPEHNPHKVYIIAFFTLDVSNDYEDCTDCEEGDCIKFLDTKFSIPDWVEGELFSHTLQQMAGITKRLPVDEQIDKNETRRN